MKRSNSMNVLVVTVSVMMGAMFFTACKKSNNEIPNVKVAALMAFNLAPDKSAIGINLSGSNLVASPIGYTGFTGSYLQIYPGTRTIQAFDNSNNAFATSDYTFDTSRYYSLFVIGNNGAYKNLVV